MDTLLSILKNVAPGIATLVAGPAGGAVVSALATKFGVSDTVEEVAKAIAGDPAAAQKLAEMDLEKFRIEEAAVTSRWEADMGSDSWLSKNIRPMGQWGQIIFLAYFGGRTIEKLADMKAKK
jgi:hypothetical protein